MRLPHFFHISYQTINTYIAVKLPIILPMEILLSKIMYERNLSVRQVEQMTGVSKSTIDRIVNESVSPTLDTLEAIAKGLNVKITDLFDSPYK